MRNILAGLGLAALLACGGEKESYIIGEATFERDIERCEEITDATVYDACVEKIALLTLDFDSCVRSKDLCNQSYCQQRVAIASAPHCKGIHQTYRQLCEDTGNHKVTYVTPCDMGN